MPARIAEAGNTSYGYPLAILTHRGFTVVVGPDVRQEPEYWAIHPDGTSLIASSLLGLLGLLCIYDHLGDEWYMAPRIDLPDGREPIDLTPNGLAKLPDDKVAAAREALGLLGSIRGRAVSAGTTREELVAAATAWVEESRQIAEFNDSDEDASPC
jgi:hypothetical protein